MKLYHALSVVEPAGDEIRSRKKSIEVRKWIPDLLPLRDLLSIQNRERLSSTGAQEDPNGKAVALVDVVAVREWKKGDMEAAGAKKWESGWWAWELVNVRPFDCPAFLPAKRRIYPVTLSS
jgi:hypothetical protein